MCDEVKLAFLIIDNICLEWIDNVLNNRTSYIINNPLHGYTIYQLMKCHMPWIPLPPRQ